MSETLRDRIEILEGELAEAIFNQDTLKIAEAKAKLKEAKRGLATPLSRRYSAIDPKPKTEKDQPKHSKNDKPKDWFCSNCYVSRD